MYNIYKIYLYIWLYILYWIILYYIVLYIIQNEENSFLVTTPALQEVAMRKFNKGNNVDTLK